MTKLCEIALKYDTDKCPEWRDGTGHEYTPFYSALLEGRSVKKVLEIGICTGASLRMWAEYFPDAEVYGLDNAPMSLISEDRIHSLLCDQSSPNDLRKVVDTFGDNFDLIIDDGSHRAEDQILSAQMLVPLLSKTGLYMIEDVQRENRDRVYEGVLKTLTPPATISMRELRTDKRSDNRLIVIERL